MRHALAIFFLMLGLIIVEKFILDATHRWAAQASSQDLGALRAAIGYYIVWLVLATAIVLCYLREKSTDGPPILILLHSIFFLIFGAYTVLVVSAGIFSWMIVAVVGWALALLFPMVRLVTSKKPATA